MEYSLSMPAAVVGELTFHDYTVVDCAEGTLRQFSLQPPKDGRKTPKVSHVNKIFVTHMHREPAALCTTPQFTY